MTTHKVMLLEEDVVEKARQKFIKMCRFVAEHWEEELL